MEKLRVRWGGDEVRVEEERAGHLTFEVESAVEGQGAVLDRDGVVLLVKFLERWLGVTR